MLLMESMLLMRGVLLVGDVLLMRELSQDVLLIGGVLLRSWRRTSNARCWQWKMC